MPPRTVLSKPGFVQLCKCCVPGEAEVLAQLEDPYPVCGPCMEDFANHLMVILHLDPQRFVTTSVCSSPHLPGRQRRPW